MSTLKKIRSLGSLLDPRFFNAANTRSTSVGFMKSFLGLKHHQDDLQHIFNYLPIAENILTAGQPSQQQLAQLQQHGVRTVINLAPHHVENALADEARIVTQLGMRYVHIPVDFKQPTEADFAQFCAAMQSASHEKTLIHCAANMRVSAFIYRYRRQVLHDQGAQVATDLGKIWTPFGVWADFIG